MAAYGERQKMALWLKQGRYKAFEDLSDAEAVHASGILKKFKKELIKRREPELLKLEAMKKARKITPDEYRIKLNEATVRHTKAMEDDFVPKILKSEKESIRDAISKMEVNNTKIVDRINENLLDPKKGIVGLKWHLDDVFETRSFRAAEEAIMGGKIFRAKSLKPSDAAELMQAQPGTIRRLWEKYKVPSREVMDARVRRGYDISYGVYAENTAAKLLNPMEREAMKILKESYQAAPTKGFFKTPFTPEGLIGTPTIKTVEKGLKSYDKLHSFIKMNMLYFSTSWVKNNMWDNASKAMVENGLDAVLPTLAMGKLNGNIADGLWDIYRGNHHRVLKNKDIYEGLQHGVVDNPMFKSVINDDVKKFMFSPKEMQVHKDRFFAKRMVGGWSQFWSNTVGAVGSHMEGTARLVTYTRTRDALMKTIKNPQLAQRIAARVARDTFFDYDKVKHFEGAVLKRLLPFYTFHSRNLGYWVPAFFDPERVGRVVNLERIRRNIGYDPTESEKQGLTDYILRGAPRLVGRSPGERTYMITPSSSYLDAINAMNVFQLEGGALSEAVEKITPLLKTPFEIFTDKDLFTKTPLRPSATGRKFLFSRGFKHYALRKGLERIGFDPDGAIARVLAVNGVQLTKKGQPFATDDVQLILDKVYSTVFPQGLLEQTAAAIGKTIYDRETALEILLDRAFPIRTVKLSERYAAKVRREKRAPPLTERQKKIKAMQEERRKARRGWR
jgi:hypothetical protein